MFASVKRAGRRWDVLNTTCLTVSPARCYWRRFHIDDSGHTDWEGFEPEPRTAQIRFSSVPESTLDALHGLRAIERKFGRIRDYRLLRDSEICSEYQAICWVAFESPESLFRISSLGATLKVTLPPRLGRPEGGPGLDDLRSLLAPESYCTFPSGSRDDSPKPNRLITLNIKRSGAPIMFRNTAKPPFRSRAMKAAIGHAFLEWAGFSPLMPLYESSPFSSPTQELPPLDSKNMRMALNKWSQILNVPDPLFPDMKPPVDAAETLPNEAEGDWEPLSEPVWRLDHRTNAAEDPKMSQITRESLKQSLEGVLQRSHLDRAPTEGSTSNGSD